MKSNRGFTLVELIIYTAIFGIAAAFLTSILVTTVRIGNKETVSNEVSNQLKLVLDTVQRVVRDSSLIEKTYEGTTESSPCTTFCALKLRMSATSLDPTVIRSDANGVYLKQGSGTEAALTNTKVKVNSLVFTKLTPTGGHSTVQVDASLQFISTNPNLAVVKTIRSAIGRVSAATFDSDLLPDADNLRNVGQIGPNLQWKFGRFSSDVTIGGSLGVGMTAPTQKIEVNGGVRLNTATAKPTCDSTTRGTFWVVQAIAGTKDDVQVCAKDAANAYAWRVIY